MCLSTVYKNVMEPASILMKNVMSIECKDGQVILTDLMDRQMAIEGQLEHAGAHAAYEQVMAAVSDFEKGNMRLQAVLASLDVK